MKKRSSNLQLPEAIFTTHVSNSSDSIFHKVGGDIFMNIY